MPQTLRKRADSLRQESSYEEGSLRSAELALSSLETLILSLTSESTILSRVDGALNELSTRVMDQSTSSIDKMLTAGLRFVFDDVDLEFKTEVTKFRGKTSVAFSLRQGGQDAPIMSSYGGGVVVVAGVLLRAVTIMSLQGRRFMVLDETLAHVSSQYVPNVSKFLNKLCAELSFDILMVTHTADFAEYADCHFKATPDKSEPDSTVITKVKHNLGEGGDE